MSLLQTDSAFIKQELAYGHQQIPKLISELHPDSREKQQALTSLVQLIHNPDNAYKTIQNDPYYHLTGLVASDDQGILLLCSEALLIISGHAIGRTYLSEPISHGRLNQLVSHENEKVNQNALETLSRMSTSKVGVQSMLQAGLFQILIERLSVEKSNLKQILILETLYQMIRYGGEPYVPDQAIHLELIDKLAGLIQYESVNHQVIEKKEKAIRVLMSLCFHRSAKRKACEKGIVNVLLNSLHTENTEFKIAITGALMSITVEVDAKKSMVRDGGIETLRALLEQKDQRVLINVVQTIANCAEDYRARFMLQSSISKLKSFIEQTESEQLKQVAERAIHVITWRP